MKSEGLTSASLSALSNEWKQKTPEETPKSSKVSTKVVFGSDFDEKTRLPYQLNPVGHKEIKEEILKNESMLRYLIRQLKVWFIGHIPIEVIRGLPKRYAYIFGSMAYCLSLGMYSYYVYENFTSFYHSPALSLSYKEEYCNTVPISVRASYLADMNGRWEGVNNFSYSNAAYSIHFSDFSINRHSQFEQMMQTYYQSVSEMSNLTKANDLAMNLIIWNSFLRFYSLSEPSRTNFEDIGKGSLQYFEFSITPSVSYARTSYGFVLGTSPTVTKTATSVNCNSSYSMIYERASGIYRVSYPMSALETNSACFKSLPSGLGTDVFQNSYLLSLELDVNSFSTAVAINMGFQTLDYLIPVSAEVDIFPFNGNISIGQQFVDFRYPKMKPIYCVIDIKEFVNGNGVFSSKNITNPLCLMMEKETVFIPVTNHIGASFNKIEACDCSTSVGSSKNCNNFNLMLSLIAFPNNANTPITTTDFTDDNQIEKTSLYKSLQLFLRYNKDYAALNQASYKAAATGVLNTIKNQTSAKIAGDDFAFCRLSDGSKCSLLTFFTLEAMRKTASPYQYLLRQGSCNDALKLSPQIWDKLVSAAPVAFIQPYYECYPTILRSVLYASGLANGVTSLTLWILLCILLPVVYISLACIRGVPSPPEYSKLVKQVTLDTLATLLLRVQDENYEGLEKNGTIDHLAVELMNSVQYAMDVDEVGSTLNDPNSPATRKGLRESQYGFEAIEEDVGLTPEDHVFTFTDEEIKRTNSNKKIEMIHRGISVKRRQLMINHSGQVSKQLQASGGRLGQTVIDQPRAQLKRKSAIAPSEFAKNRKSMYRSLYGSVYAKNNPPSDAGISFKSDNANNRPIKTKDENADTKQHYDECIRNPEADNWTGETNL